MDFKLLNSIIKTLKQRIKCEKCNRKFTYREINILDIHETQITVSCDCHKCKNKTMLEIDLTPTKEFIEKAKASRKPQGIKMTAKQLRQITSDDILDVKNFLRDFTGDFKTLFKK